MPRLAALQTPPALAALARAQGGCVLRSQAREAGVSSHAAAARLGRGIWGKLHGCLVLEEGGGTVDAHLREAWALALRCGAGKTIVSGTTALHLCRVAPPPRLGTSVIVRCVPNRRPRIRGVRVQPWRTTDRAHRRLPGGLLVHRGVQAVLDIVRVATPEEGRRWLDWALHARILTAADISVELEGTQGPLRRRDRQHAADHPVRLQERTRLRLALEYVHEGTRSEAEQVLRRMLRDGEITDFRCDVPVWDNPDGPPFARLDFGCEALRIALEVDGRAHHSSAADFERDRVRQNRLVGAGWTVLRFTWDMLQRGAADILEQVRTMIATKAAQNRRSERPICAELVAGPSETRRHTPP